METKAFIVADEVVPGAQNKAVINGVFDVVFAKSFPAMHKSLATFFAFEGKNKKYKYELFLKYKGNRMKITETEFDKNNKQHKVISKINNLPFPNEGEYIFEVDLDKKLVASASIEVRKI